MRRAKIICTLGPAVDSIESVRALVAAGMDVARLNLSHGKHEDHDRRYQWVRQASAEAGRAVGILADLQGPKIRLGTFASGPVELVAGQTFTITTREVPGDLDCVSTGYAGLPGDVSPGDRLLLDDGKVGLRATSVTDTDVVTVVEVPGLLSSNKGVNLPGVAVSVPALSEKDEDDLRWAIRCGVDLVALSFVRSGSDVTRVHEIMAEEQRVLPVIAKIEKPQAVANFESVLAAFDGIMVARGDLGVELALEDVPIVQKRAVEYARRAAKPVIVATQVLESMISAPRPTRAEASDAANAVLDGADALMLSGETSIGQYPIQAVETMARIISSTEQHGLDRIAPLTSQPSTVGGAVTAAAVQVAQIVGATCLAVFTESGASARRMARLRSAVPLIAFSPRAATRAQLTVTWGCETLTVQQVHHTDAMVAQVDDALTTSGICQVGDIVVIVAGTPPGVTGSTNMVRVHRVGTDN